MFPPLKLPAGIALILACPALLVAAAESELSGLRPIQVEYPRTEEPRVGRLVAFWALRGAFDEIRILVDDTQVRVMRGDSTSSGLGSFPLGRRRMEVRGIEAGIVASSTTAEIEVLAEEPALGAETEGCIFYAFKPGDGGFLEVFWKNRDTPELPYVDYEILVNGTFSGVIGTRTSSFRFERVPLGTHRIDLLPYTFNHLCPPARFDCVAEEVQPVLRPDCRLEACEEGGGRLRIVYDVPPDALLDGVAAFRLREGEAAAFLGNFDPGSPIDLDGVAPGEPADVELVSFRGDSASTVPSVPGPEHVIVRCIFDERDCDRIRRFRRGDCDGDGAMDITDDIFHLTSLFSGGSPPLCRDACDANDDGSEDIADPIAALSFKFLGGAPPPLPFQECGRDPSADGLDCGGFHSCQ